MHCLYDFAVDDVLHDWLQQRNTSVNKATRPCISIAQLAAVAHAQAERRAYKRISVWQLWQGYGILINFET